ncbi:MAG: hypothetical protein AB1724_17685 [Thermodesulfobacteriota bacterium]
MRMSYASKLFLAMLGVLLITGISGALTSADDRPLLVLADLSGSSQEKMGYFNSPEKTTVVRITRAEAIREILTEFARTLPASYCPVGLFELRYLSGDKSYCVPVTPVAAYQAGDLQKRVEDDLTTTLPVFNRRTPLADGLRQLDESVLKSMDGRAVVLLISDGGENIRSGKNNEDENKSIRVDDPVKEPLTEVLRLKLAYGDKLVFHAIGLDRGTSSDQKEQDQEALALLQKMAAAGGGKYFSARELLQDRKTIAELYPLLCGTAGLLTE